MAFPVLLKKLFKNEGAGPELREDIIPQIPASKLPDDYLPLSGGTMTGTIRTTVGSALMQSSDDSYLGIYGGSSYSKGAYAIFYGANHADYPGEIRFSSRNANSVKTFVLKPDGTGSWDGNALITSAGGLISGTLNVRGTIRSNNNNSYLDLQGGKSWGYGAYINLYGQDHASKPSAFEIHARNMTTGAWHTLYGSHDGTLLWKGESVQNPVGTIIAFASNSAPNGYLVCNGSAVSRTTYAKLFEAIGTTYGSGDGSTTFNLPNLTDKFIQGSGTAGSVKNAGLPNITGAIRAEKEFRITNASGAFTKAAEGQSGAGNIVNNSYHGFDFDASKSNAIYGASDTVQPPALTMRYYIKY